MSSLISAPTKAIKKEDKGDVIFVSSQEASGVDSNKEMVPKKSSSKGPEAIFALKSTFDDTPSPRLMMASPSPQPVTTSSLLESKPVVPSPLVISKPVTSSASLKVSSVATSLRLSSTPVSATTSLRPPPASPSLRLSPKPETPPPSLKSKSKLGVPGSLSQQSSPKPSSIIAPLSSPRVSIIEPTTSSPTSLSLPCADESSGSPVVTAPRTLPILTLPASSSCSSLKGCGIASAPTPSSTETFSLSKQPISAPVTPKLTTLLSTPTTIASVQPTSSSSVAETAKPLKTTVSSRKTKERKTTSANSGTLASGIQLKPGVSFNPNMMGQPIFYRPAGSNQLVQFYQQPMPAVLQQMQKLRGETPALHVQTTTAATVLKPSGPVPIAPRPVNLPSTSTVNTKVAPKKPTGPLNIRPRPVEKRPILNSQPGPSTSLAMSNPSVVSILQRAPNNVAMYYPQGVRFAAPIQGTSVSGVGQPPINQAFRMMHSATSGIFPTQIPPGSMMSPGGYMPYSFMGYTGPQFVHMPAVVPPTQVPTGGAEESVPAAESTSAPRLTEQGPSVAQTATANTDEDENDPPPPLLEPDQASMESPPPPRRSDVVSSVEIAITAPKTDPDPIPSASTQKGANDIFWKQASKFQRLRKPKNDLNQHLLKNNVIEEKPNPFTATKTPAQRLADLRDPKKATKRTPQRPLTPETTKEVKEVQTNRRGQKKKISASTKPVVKTEPKKTKTMPKKVQNSASRSAPTTMPRRSARSISSRSSSRYSETPSKNTPTFLKTNSHGRTRKGRANEIEKLIAMDFGSGKSPFQTTDVSEYVKKVKKESTLLRPTVAHSYLEHDDYDDEEEDDYDSITTEETSPECEDDSTTVASQHVESDDEEEVCLGCKTPFKNGLRSAQFPQYCTKACRVEYRDAARQRRKRQSGAMAPSSSSASRDAGGLDDLPEQPHDAQHTNDDEPTSKHRRLSAEEVKAPTPSLPQVSESSAAKSPTLPSHPPFNQPEFTPTPPAPEPIDPFATPTSSLVPPPSAAPNTSPLNEHQKALDAAGLCAANVQEWTADEVAIWVNVVTNSSIHGDAFRSEEIDGSSLLMLNSEHLKDVLKFKLGPALKLGKAIDWLRNISEA